MNGERLQLSQVAMVMSKFPGFNKRQYDSVSSNPPACKRSFLGELMGRKFRETSKISTLDTRDVEVEFNYFSGGDVEIFEIHSVGEGAVCLESIQEEEDEHPLAIVARRIAEEEGVRWGATYRGTFFPEFRGGSVQNYEQLRERITGIISANQRMRTILNEEADRLYSMAPKNPTSR